MAREDQAFDDALALVKSARAASCPNPGFMEQLKSYKPQENIHINGH